jgi:tRNA nucleotidyltransferase (CCA-adding enzyme)
MMIKGSEIVEKQVLKRITPTSWERKKLAEVVEALKLKIDDAIEKTGLPVASEVVGSTAKDTYLRGNLDIDLFLLYPTSIGREELEETGLSIGRSVLEEKEECYAEHPYVRGYFKGFKTEIVPCYRIEYPSQKLSAVDRTPLHTRYIKKHLKRVQKKEVRLFKQFLHGIGCYGAEAEVEGFSGYLCEILILKYGTFQGLIWNSRKWRRGEKLSLTPGDFPDFDTSLVFIDPVDPNRNVSSALSDEKFNFFIKACKEYVANPRITFFFPNKIKPWRFEEINKKIKGFIGVEIEKPDIIPENLFPQVRKAVRSIKEMCEKHDFTLSDIRYHIADNRFYIIILPKKMVISARTTHKGPPVGLKKNADEFLEKWSRDPRTIGKPFVKNKRLYVEIKRDYTDIRCLLRDKIGGLNLGKQIDVRKGFSVLEDKDLLTPDLRMFWSEYLDGRMPWER